MGGEQRGQDASATGGDPAASNYHPPDGEPMRAERSKVSARGRSGRWTRKQKIAVMSIAVPAIVAVVVALVTSAPWSSPNGVNSGSSGTSHSQLQDNGGSGGNQAQNNGTNNGQVGNNITNNNYAPTSSSVGLSSSPQAQIVQLTGSYNAMPLS